MGMPYTIGYNDRSISYGHLRRNASRLPEHPDVRGEQPAQLGRMDRPLVPGRNNHGVVSQTVSCPKPPRSYGFDVDWNAPMMQEDHGTLRFPVNDTGETRPIVPPLLPYVTTRCIVRRDFGDDFYRRLKSHSPGQASGTKRGMGHGVIATRGRLVSKTKYEYKKALSIRRVLHAFALTNTLKFYTHPAARLTLRDERESLEHRLYRSKLPMDRKRLLLSPLLTFMSEDAHCNWEREGSRFRRFVVLINVAQRPLVRSERGGWIFKECLLA
ncbi:hypothetical protein C8Q74DRAFT_1257425 [Fomes fomentarius]|nr:hypothetical protein C8Q74DRAFT_1257425 [Fomes fomentarius]